ncbi:MAG: hypothetical protein ABR543_06920 [Gemmatimonadaceae bacterium]
MKLTSLILATTALAVVACSDSVHSPPGPQHGERVFTRVTASGDTIALYLTVENGKVARMRHVQNGKLLVESTMEAGKRQILLHGDGKVLKTDLNESGAPVLKETIPPSARLPHAIRKSIRLLAGWAGPQPVEAQGNACVSEIAQAMDAAARIAELAGAIGGLPGILAPPLARLADAIAQYGDATRRLADCVRTIL